MDLLVLAKEPVAGRVKTRLCPPCSPAQAARIAEAALADTMAAAVSAGADRVVLALDGAPGPWCPAGVDVVAQVTGGLHRRLAGAWSNVRGPTLQIGMDTPHAGADGLAAAMRTLLHAETDAVLGPAFDGGWWAAGMRRPDPAAFLGVLTSRVDTGARQWARLLERGLRVTGLPAMRDLDTWDDAVALGYDHVLTGSPS